MGGRGASHGQEEDVRPVRHLSYCPRHSMEAEEALARRWRRRERKGSAPANFRKQTAARSVREVWGEGLQRVQSLQLRGRICMDMAYISFGAS
jgi:hypothetical protein